MCQKRVGRHCLTASEGALLCPELVLGRRASRYLTELTRCSQQLFGSCSTCTQTLDSRRGTFLWRAIEQWDACPNLHGHIGQRDLLSLGPLTSCATKTHRLADWAPSTTTNGYNAAGRLRQLRLMVSLARTPGQDRQKCSGGTIQAGSPLRA